MAKTKKKPGGNVLAVNRRARHEYHLEEILEAGIALQGWEIKSIRAGRVQIAESYVLIKNGEAWLFGAHITPLPSASTHIEADPSRTRKLLLHCREINMLIGATQRQGRTVVPLSLYLKRGKAKLEIALAVGKKKHDKRAAEKDKDWQREKARIIKQR